eukprot:TRINITY_DN9762_c0_g1_i1.p3 TRINITY_DN9762_c0_g1~~TRINITY_DN9762_c0_g1_i1.p3  ORF type:complete len:104 (-),score=15.70 TRINITY_DN9762_c0_g1_i1:68-379(-)
MASAAPWAAPAADAELETRHANRQPDAAGPAGSAPSSPQPSTAAAGIPGASSSASAAGAAQGAAEAIAARGEKLSELSDKAAAVEADAKQFHHLSQQLASRSA